jgi:rRNA-processing protein FCF1
VSTAAARGVRGGGARRRAARRRARQLQRDARVPAGLDAGVDQPPAEFEGGTGSDAEMRVFVQAAQAQGVDAAHRQAGGAPRVGVVAGQAVLQQQRSRQPALAVVEARDDALDEVLRQHQRAVAIDDQLAARVQQRGVGLGMARGGEQFERSGRQRLARQRVARGGEVGADQQHRDARRGGARGGVGQGAGGRHGQAFAGQGSGQSREKALAPIAASAGQLRRICAPGDRARPFVTGCTKRGRAVTICRKLPDTRRG